MWKKTSNFFGLDMYEIFSEIDKIWVWETMRKAEPKSMLMTLRNMEWL